MQEQCKSPMQIVTATVVDVQRQLPLPTCHARLIDAGSIGMVEACSGYSSAIGTSFGVYARSKVRAAVLAEVETTGSLWTDLEQLSSSVRDGELTGEPEKATEVR